ncbi:MAG: septum formation family protein, partial [Actinomycetia bacterium]|nr:septum formation family protein [Actinomycetes bacterium]
YGQPGGAYGQQPGQPGQPGGYGQQPGGQYGQPGGAYGAPAAAYPYAGQPPAGPQGPSSALSTTSFVLALFGCLPLLSIAAIITGIIALVRNHASRGLAIAGIALGTIWTALLGWFWLSGAAADFVDDVRAGMEEEQQQRRDTPTVGSTGGGGGLGEQSMWDLKLGDCYNDPQGHDESMGTNISIVDCDVPHEFEVYHEYSMTERDYPGDEETYTQAEETCVEAFEDFIGFDYQFSEIYLSYFVPTQRTWATGDRIVICVATDGPGTTGTLEGAGR